MWRWAVKVDREKFCVALEISALGACSLAWLGIGDKCSTDNTVLTRRQWKNYKLCLISVL